MKYIVRRFVLGVGSALVVGGWGATRFASEQRAAAESATTAWWGEELLKRLSVQPSSLATARKAGRVRAPLADPMAPTVTAPRIEPVTTAAAPDELDPTPATTAEAPVETPLEAPEESAERSAAPPMVSMVRSAPRELPGDTATPEPVTDETAPPPVAETAPPPPPAPPQPVPEYVPDPTLVIEEAAPGPTLVVLDPKPLESDNTRVEAIREKIEWATTELPAVWIYVGGVLSMALGAGLMGWTIPRPQGWDSGGGEDGAPGKSGSFRIT